jgi:hypothetical protein
MFQPRHGTPYAQPGHATFPHCCEPLLAGRVMGWLSDRNTVQGGCQEMLGGLYTQGMHSSLIHLQHLALTAHHHPYQDRG